MLLTPLLHPGILAALARSGHGSRVLIADGNYPLANGAAASAERVYLNLRPGLVQVTEVLSVLVAAIPIESVLLMTPPDGQAVPIHGEFRAILPAGALIRTETRGNFYDQARSADTTLAIATGESRRFANLLLTIGVVKNEAP